VRSMWANRPSTTPAGVAQRAQHSREQHASRPFGVRRPSEVAGIVSARAPWGSLRTNGR
jgi:hypothetical protein